MNIVQSGNRYQVYGEDVQTFKDLPVRTYAVSFHPMQGFSLVNHNDLEINEDTVYGLHAYRAEKVLKSFEAANRNFGIILSGRKGIGKSLLARMIAEESMKRDMPVIVVDTAYPGIANFLASIQQEVTIIFDEFEKTFAPNPDGNPQVEMLGLFDGIDNGKKLFVVTCNSIHNLNEFFINRPGRFHYHFEISCPSPDEVQQYMIDKLGTGWEEEIDRIIRISQLCDITFDSLRAIAFDLKQGYSLDETLADLNISYEENTSFDVTVRLSNGWVATNYNNYINLVGGRRHGGDEYSIRFTAERNDFYVKFNVRDLMLANGVITVPVDKLSVVADWDAFDEDEAKQKEFNNTVTVTSITFNKVVNTNTVKYINL